MTNIDLTPPLAVRLAYQNSQMATGTYTQGGSQVFSHLVSPPATGVAAEEASDDAAEAVGFTAYEAANEVQTIDLGGATGGTFRVTFGTYITDDLAYGTSTSDLQVALRALSSVASGVTVGGSTGKYDVTAGGALAGKELALLGLHTADLTGCTTTPGVTRKTRGHGAFSNDAAADVSQQRDWMRSFYDSASGNHF